MFETVKTFTDFPCTHRQWRHKGHCRFVHGYSRGFTFWFQSRELDINQFVVDFSDLKDLRARLKQQFDHTFLVSQDDPLLHHWQQLDKLGAIDLRIMTNVGMEASAQLIWTWANEIIWAHHHGRVCCWRTESRENEKNAALFSCIPEWFVKD